MSSTNKTEELGLNQWIGSDIPKMDDFNSDNAKIDKTVGEHIGDSSIHVTAQQKRVWSNPIGCLSYIGDGSSNRSLKLNMGLNRRSALCLRLIMPWG